MFEKNRAGLAVSLFFNKGEKPLLTHGQQTAKWDLVSKDISTVVIIRFRDLQLYQYPESVVGSALFFLSCLKKYSF